MLFIDESGFSRNWTQDIAQQPFYVLAGVCIDASEYAAACDDLRTKVECLNLPGLEFRLGQGSEIKARDQEIAKLKQDLQTQRAASTGPSGPTSDEIEKTKQDVLKDIESRSDIAPTLQRALDEDLPGARGKHPGDDLHQRALPRPVRAHKSVHLAGADLE